MTEDEVRQELAIVEKWAAEHPAKTRQSELLKLFPETELDKQGVSKFCPMSFILVNGKHSCPDGSVDCYDCRRKFWLAEVE